MRIRLGASALLCLAACRHAAPAVTPSLSPFQVEEPVTATIAAALAADSRGESADSLWDSEATVIADGEIRDDPPRFAVLGVVWALVLLVLVGWVVIAFAAKLTDLAARVAGIRPAP